MWSNPYRETNSRSIAAAENRKRVERLREERAFMLGMRDRFKLTHMDEVRHQLQQEREEKLAAYDEAKRSRSASAAVQNGDESAARRAASGDEVVDPLKCVSEFSAAVRCLEMTHGGATLWTGEEDGSIGIRNGVTGALVYVIDKHQEGLYVDTLHCHDSLMWVGLSSGAIRVYDAQVFVLVYEGQVHNKSVSAFAQTFDGKIFSASVDGTIAKWEIEGSSLEVAAHLTGNTSALRCITTYGYNLFAGADDTMIHCLDTETGATTQLFEGHSGPVTAVLVIAGLLVSASEDGTMGVWNIATGARQQALEHGGQPVTAMMPDAVGENVWSADTTGTIRLWALRKGIFAPLRQIALEPGSAVLSLKGLVAIDAVKVWTMGSNGQCHVWHAANNKIEGATRAALRAMQAIIAEDEVELAKWAELIKTMEEVFLRLKDAIAANMLITTERAGQRQAYFTWLRFVLFSHLRKTKRFIAERLELASAQRARRAAFRKLQAWLQTHKQQRAKDAVVLALQRDRERQLVNVFFAKMQTHTRVLRAREVRLNHAAALQRRTTQLLASRFIQVFRRFVDFKKLRRKQLQVATAMALGNDSAMLNQAFVRWAGLRIRAMRRREQAKAAAALMASAEENLRRRYFTTWLRAARCASNQRQRQKATLAMLLRSDRWLLQTAYSKLARYAAERRDARLEQEYDAGQSRVAALREQLNAIEHLVRRRRLLDDAQTAINAALQERLRRQERIKQLEDEAVGLRQAIAVKREGAKAKREQSVAEQIADLIAELKCKLLNLHADFTIISKTVEKSRHVAAPKIFLEAHQAVKRVVVELTNDPYLPADAVWPLTHDLVKQLKSHQVEQVLTAIKTMIITFDIMTPTDRASLSSDKEIVLNAEWINAIADTCLRMKLKRLGKNAFRAK